MDEAAPDLDAVLERLRARVEERRRAGLYPPGLEDALDEHFRRIVAFRAAHDHLDLRERIAALDARSRFTAEVGEVQSRVPGGRVLHQAAAKATSRQTQAVIDQVQRYADGLREVLVAVADGMEDPAHVHADLVDSLDAVLERLAAIERRTTAAEAALEALTDRVARLEGTGDVV